MTTAPHRPAVLTKPVALGVGLSSGSERIFVSPRVVDEQAFGEFSSELRALLEQMREAQAELERAGASAAGTTKELQGSQAKYRQHLELTTKLLKAMTAKSAEVEQTLAKLEARSERAEQIEARAAGLLEAKVAGFETKLEDRLKKAEASYEQRLAALESRFEQRRASLEREMDEFESRVRAKTDEQRSSLEAEVSARIREAESELSARASEAARDTLERLGTEQEAAARAIAELESAREALSSVTAASLENTLEQLREACGIASKLVGWDPADPASNPDEPCEGSLGELLRRSVSVKEDADWSVRRLGSLRDQARAAVDELGETLDGSVALLDQLHAQRKRVEAEIGELLERSSAIDGAAGAQGMRAAELAASLDEAVGRAEHALRDLCAGMSGAGELVADCRGAREQLGEVASLAHGLAERLEPWRGVMFGEDAPEELPRALAAVVERFEERFGHDLVRMAETIEVLLSRAGAGDQR